MSGLAQWPLNSSASTMDIKAIFMADAMYSCSLNIRQSCADSESATECIVPDKLLHSTKKYIVLAYLLQPCIYPRTTVSRNAVIQQDNYVLGTEVLVCMPCNNV